MVRPDDQSGRKAGAGSKRWSSTGKSGPEPYNAPLWPCEMNGCGKQFVREADLRRHQRTTKLHSFPSYVCGQCNASFTRTDALRRHEKSKNHVARGPFQNSSVFIEDSVGATLAETKTTSTSSERSTRSRSSRSLSPGPSREKEKERRERERFDRELPPLGVPSSAQYYRPHTVTTILYEQPPPSSNPQLAPASRPQTHSSSLNAILASPISTPRLHPASWSSSPPRQSRAIPSHDGYASRPLPPPFPSNGHYHHVPHYRYPSPPTRMESQLLGPAHPTPLSHEHEPTRSGSPTPGDEHHMPRGQGICQSTARTLNSKGKEGSSTASATMVSPPPVPPIASTELLPLETLSDNSDSSASEDSADESEDEVDELEPTDSEAEPDPEGFRARGPACDRIISMSETEVASHGEIPDIDIEACIDPATGITEEEVKEAMDAVRKQEREQAEAEADNAIAVDAHAHRHHIHAHAPTHDGALGVGAIGIRASAQRNLKGAAVDHDVELPFLSEMVLPSSSTSTSTSTSTLVNGGDSDIRGSHGVHGRLEHGDARLEGVGRLLNAHRSPGSGGRTRREYHSPSPSPSPSHLEDPRDHQHDHDDDHSYLHHHLHLPQHLHHQHRYNRSHSTGHGGSEDEGIDVHVSTSDLDIENGNMNMKVEYIERFGGKLAGGGKALDSGINGPNLNDHRSHDDAYGHHPISLDRSLSPLDSHHRLHHLPEQNNNILDEDERADQHMLHI